MYPSLVGLLLAGMMSPGPDSTKNTYEKAAPLKDPGRANVPVLMKDNRWILQVPPDMEEDILLCHVPPPETVFILESGQGLAYKHKDGSLRIPMASAVSGKGELLEIRWKDTRWSQAVEEIERRYENRAPSDKTILFLGSSSIRMWDLERFFPELSPLNCGFGGSTYWDALYYAERLVFRHRPCTLVLYDGDNDIALGRSPEWVLADLKALVSKIHHALPETRIIVLSIKNSVSRWHLKDTFLHANRLMKDYANSDPRIGYLDVDTPLLGEDKKPRQDLFMNDQLHLNLKGYQIWADRVHSLL